jgi:hypothetical protein
MRRTHRGFNGFVNGMRVAMSAMEIGTSGRAQSKRNANRGPRPGAIGFSMLMALALDSGVSFRWGIPGIR